MLLKQIVVISMLVFQSIFFFKNNKIKSSYALFITFSVYSIKSIVDNYLPFLSLFIQILIAGGFILCLYNTIRNRETIYYNKYMFFYLFLISINGLLNFARGENGFDVYLISFFNYVFILVFMIYLSNNIKEFEHFNFIATLTKFNGVLLFLLALIDRFILGVARVGVDVNPNYFSQMAITMLILHLLSWEKVFSFSSLTYISLILYTVLLTQSSSGILAIIIIIFSVLLFKFINTNLIEIFMILFWGSIILYMGVVVYTSDTQFGLLKFFVKDDDLSRVYLWQETFKAIQTNFILGNTYYNSFRIPWTNLEMVTHNDFLRIFVELGFFGIVTFFMFIQNQIRIIKTIIPKYGVFLFIFILTTLTYSLSHNNIQNFMFWFPLALPSFKIFKSDKLKKKI